MAKLKTKKKRETKGKKKDNTFTVNLNNYHAYVCQMLASLDRRLGHLQKTTDALGVALMDMDVIDLKDKGK